LVFILKSIQLFGKINDKKCRKGVARFKLNASNGEYLNQNK